jgi:acetylornithine deacetylase
VTTVVDHLLALVRIPSASALSNRAVIDYAHTAFQNAQWTTVAHSTRDASGTEKINLIAAPPGQDPTASNVDLAFLCHTDTVPPATDWAAALAPFVREGMLHGCGACDVKGFLACLLTAASEVAAASIKPAVRIVLTADEEIGCLGAHRLVAEGRLRARSLVIGEPTSLHAARAGKGYCLGAEECHLAEELATLRNEFFDPPYTTLNVGTIRGGSAKNIVPGECSFLLEWRPIPRQTPDLIPLAIERIGRELKQADPAFRFAFKILRQQLGFETPGDAGLVRTMENLTGRAPIAIPFGSEASVFSSLAEEIVVFGPGDMRTAHSPRECVPVSELHEAVRTIKALMQKS